MEMIQNIEINLNKKAKIVFMNKQKGDMEKTFASLNLIKKDYSFKPKIEVKTGIRNFVSWFLNYNSK